MIFSGQFGNISEKSTILVNRTARTKYNKKYVLELLVQEKNMYNVLVTYTIKYSQPCF